MMDLFQGEVCDCKALYLAYLSSIWVYAIRGKLDALMDLCQGKVCSCKALCHQKLTCLPHESAPSEANWML